MTNKYKVPQKQWKKWSSNAKYTFNEVFGSTKKQKLLYHPAAAIIPDEHWTTLRWNFAWIAANASDGDSTRIAG